MCYRDLKASKKPSDISILAYALFSVAFIEMINLVWISLNKINDIDLLITVRQMFTYQNLGFCFDIPLLNSTEC